MANGTVKWFNTTKGYGFITPEDGSTDIFVHISALEASGIKNLVEEQKISYEIEDNRGKSMAVNIQALD